MLFKTKKCREFEHPEFCIKCNMDVISSCDIEWILSFLENEVKRGIRFKTDETIQIGWMLDLFKLMDDGYLHILEPDFNSLPIIFIDSMTNTLKQLRQQKDIVESIDDDIDISFTSIVNSMAVCETYKNAKNAFLSREEPENSFSGWFFRNLESDDEEYSLISLYDFACHRPDLVKFLGLPSQYGVQTCPDNGFRIINEEREVPLKAGSFLDQINMVLTG
jgi:hypothetical protein